MTDESTPLREGVCPACGAASPATAIACDRCGEGLFGRAAQDQRTGAAPRVPGKLKEPPAKCLTIPVRKCPSCNHELDPENVAPGYCPNCKEWLPAPVTEDSTVSGVPESPQPAYLVLKSDRLRVPISIFPGQILGRGAAGSEALADWRTVSAMHCRLDWDAKRHTWFVVDLSMNGTWVEDKRLDMGVPADLKPGDTLRVADLTLAVTSGPED